MPDPSPSHAFGDAYRLAKRRLATKLLGSYSLAPRYIQIQLVYACNLRCWFCGQWGSRGQSKQLGGNQLGRTLSLGLLKRLVDELPWVSKGIFLYGGEPLLHPDVIPFIRYATQKQKHCSMVTNGTFLAKQAAGLVRSGLKELAVSLDGTEASNDQYRGKGSYQAAIEGIRAIRLERDRLGKSLPKIVTAYTLLPDNAKELPALVPRVKEAGADCIYVSRLNFLTRDMGQAHEHALRTLFQIEALSWQAFYRTEELGDPRNVKALIEEVKSSPELAGFTILEEPGSHWTSDDWCRYYRDPAYVLPSNRSCRFPWDAMCVCPNGDVVTCPDFPDYVAGNLHRQSFSAIWNGEKMRQFRRSLAKYGRLPICSICCHLYED